MSRRSNPKLKGRRLHRMIRDGLMTEVISERLGVDLVKGRSCGDCDRCCVQLKIEQMSKPAGQPCEKLKDCGGGCSVYHRRPWICKGFYCGWLIGWGAEEDRPDKSGMIMMDVAPKGSESRPHVTVDAVDDEATTSSSSLLDQLWGAGIFVYLRIQGERP